MDRELWRILSLWRGLEEHRNTSICVQDSECMVQAMWTDAISLFQKKWNSCCFFRSSLFQHSIYLMFFFLYRQEMLPIFGSWEAEHFSLSLWRYPSQAELSGMLSSVGIDRGAANSSLGVTKGCSVDMQPMCPVCTLVLSMVQCCLVILDQGVRDATSLRLMLQFQCAIVVCSAGQTTVCLVHLIALVFFQWWTVGGYCSGSFKATWTLDHTGDFSEAGLGFWLLKAMK